MSDPVKNLTGSMPGAQPESYQPQKPEMMRALEAAQRQTEAQGAFQAAASSSGGSGSIPNIHRLINSDHGENYWFNGCAAYVMEALGEPDYDYWFFAGLTGDNFAPVYAYDHFRGDGSVTDYRLSDGDHSTVLGIFSTCGYDADFVPETVLRADPEPYLQKLVDYIDRGIPVIRYWCGWHVCVGYEDYGKTLLCMTGDNEEPYRVTAEELFEGGQKHKDAFHWFGWIFVGEKKEQKDLPQLYRNAIANLPKLLSTRTEGYCFGAEAFRAWAANIESGKFDGMKPEEFEGFGLWDMYTIHVCNLATNSGGSQRFIRKALELNPDLAFLEDVCRQYRITGMLWNSREDSDGFAKEYAKQHGKAKDLAKLGGGFKIKLKTLQNPRKRAKIVAVIRQCADCMDEVVRILEKEVRGL